MNRRRLPIFLTILLSLLLLVLLAQCQPQAPTPEPEITPTPTLEPEITPSRTPLPDPEMLDDARTLPPATEIPQVEIRPEQSLIADQIIVTGGAGDIARVIPDPAELGLAPLASTTFEYLGEYQLPGDERQQTSGKRLRLTESWVAQQQELANLRVDLYGIVSDTVSLEDVLQAVAARVADPDIQDELEIGVLAEPNYVTGFEITGNPWNIEGSPWNIEGSGDGSASPTGNLFWEQTALGTLSAGVNLFAGSAALEGRNIDESGGNVEVAVFDTSPFEGEGRYLFSGWGPPEDDALEVTVSDPLVLPTSTPVDPDKSNISDHGLFVSGLVYAVAPDSDIHLIRVLNDEGQGTLQGFVSAFDLYLRQRLSDVGSLRNTVINLSLGTSEPDDSELPEDARRAIAQMLDLWKGVPLASEGAPVFSLEIPMRIAETYGATIVAAAGNDSHDVSSPRPSQIPAAYDVVVSVGSSNHSSTRSCYSNDSEVLAPGGEGDGTDDAGQVTCLPVHDTKCTADQADCEYGVISYAMSATQGFAYWVGTSFAAPLVSGLAADIIQARGGPPPNVVRDTIMCSAQSTGVVDAVAALTACP